MVLRLMPHDNPGAVAIPALAPDNAPAVPWIIDYPIVLDHMRSLGMRSLYYQSGSFGFGSEAPTHVVGWIGPADETIRPEAQPFTRQVAEPFEQNLAGLLIRAWREILPGRMWIMPGSHWAYELDFGSREWMPAVLEHVGIDPGMLQSRTNAAAIEFAPDETAQAEHLVLRLLDMLAGSDFAVAFPHRPITCTLHHHKQFWWTSPDATLIDCLGSLMEPNKGPRRD